jgi:hypothetical protein
MVYQILHRSAGMELVRKKVSASVLKYVCATEWGILNLPAEQGNPSLKEKAQYS